MKWLILPVVLLCGCEVNVQDKNVPPPNVNVVKPPDVNVVKPPDVNVVKPPDVNVTPSAPNVNVEINPKK